MASTVDAVQETYIIEEILRGWGRWANQRNSMGYTSIFGVILDMCIGRMVDPHKNYSQRITDDEALKVEEALGQLLLRSPELYSLVAAIYRYGWSMEGISKRTGVRWDTIKSAHERAIGFVDGQLYGKIGELVA